MEKYRKVPREREPTGEGEIRVTSIGRVQSYVSYAARLFNEEKRDELLIKATGGADASGSVMVVYLSESVSYVLDGCCSLVYVLNVVDFFLLTRFFNGGLW